MFRQLEHLVLDFAFGRPELSDEVEHEAGAVQCRTSLHNGSEP
jgi:hypothetical protein